MQLLLCWQIKSIDGLLILGENNAFIIYTITIIQTVIPIKDEVVK
jgi:hypothetical protein